MKWLFLLFLILKTYLVGCVDNEDLNHIKLPEEWIEIYDMEMPSPSINPSVLTQKVNGFKSEESVKECSNNLSDTVHMFLKRYINIFLTATKFDNLIINSGEYVTEHFEITISEYELEELKKLMEDTNLELKNKLSAIDEIMSNVLSKPKVYYTQTVLEGLTSYLNDFIDVLIPWLRSMCSYDMFYMMSVLLGFVFYKTVSRSIASVMLFTYNNLIVIDSFKCYWEQHQDNLNEKHWNLSQLEGTECDVNKISWWTQMYRDVVMDPCKQKYMEYGRDVSASLPQCFMSTYSQFIIVKPFHLFGSAVSEFNKQLTANVPFPMNYIVYYGIITTAVTILLSLLSSFLFGSDVQLGTFLLNVNLTRRRREEEVEPRNRVQHVIEERSQPIVPQVNISLHLSNDGATFTRQHSTSSTNVTEDQYTSTSNLALVSGSQEDLRVLNRIKQVPEVKKKRFLSKIEELIEEEVKDGLSVVDSDTSEDNSHDRTDIKELKQCISQLLTVISELKSDDSVPQDSDVPTGSQ